MKFIFSSVLLILIFNIISCLSVSIVGRVYPNTILPDVKDLSSNTEIILNGGEYVAYLKHDNSFEVKNVKPGVYILQVNTKNYVFGKFWIVVDESNNVVAAKEAMDIEVSPSFIKENQCNYPLELQAVQKKDYFNTRASIDVLSFLKNPLVLLMLGSIGIMFVLPKMVSGLDEEELKEVKKNQSNVQDFMNKASNGDLSQMFSSFLAETQMGGSKVNKRK
ncbi:hypothetical protein BCR32DRAFT_268799 [Anaeromyces robustus]|jgi:hypothetical protein|uniref:ER membrane protein complex subunit 7 beta-sandwich domain-containing protein n=1 Tax=Anaeromyces robustus TaxID=1754192 RepID=A0A1Y1X4K7_9FUNG|nr:hypothetical protein BCR32DRAFT_268799 [Anaeromyces robustus]|eukprot:ORX80585.1 hypothetical protein BCR32DRAFT_268799 [Anaeromyces robustus]